MSKSPKELKIVSRYLLSKKDRKKLEEEAEKELGKDYVAKIQEAERVEIAIVKHPELSELYFLDNTLAFVRLAGDGFIPSLYYIYKANLSPSYPSIYVDAGAVPKILNGADVMVPGIKKIEGEFGPTTRVLVKELDKARTIAIGISLMSSQEIKTSQKGKAIKTLHYLGDEVWNLSTK